MKISVTVENEIGHLDGYLMPEEYGKKYSIKEGLVRKYIYLGKLPAIKVGHGWWIKEDEPLPPKVCNMKLKDQIEYKQKNRDRLNPKYFKLEGVYREPFEKFYPIVREHGATPEALLVFYDEFAKIPKSRNGKIKKKFLWWPRWTDENDIFKWFDEKYPGGLIELMKKRVGPEHWEAWEEFSNKNRLSMALLMAEPPELVRTRQRLKEKHSGAEPFIIPDPLTEEDKEKLFQEFLNGGK